MPLSDNYRPDPRFPLLGNGFADEVEPADFPEHILRFRNDRAASGVGLDGLDDREWINHFGRFEALPDNLPTPLAMRYHGHQFRHYNRDLGDGRGFLFAQMRDDRGRLLDLGTKGSGQTPWSRQGDGRLTLKGAVRELLATEMLDAMGLDTSATFSVIETGEALYRGDEPSPTRSAVMVRLSHSHIRIGSFQRHAYNNDQDRITHLMNHVIEEYMPDLANVADKDRPVAFVTEVARNVARLGAGIMAAGFVHGVLNTDNINVTGECFDYGPYRFVPTFDPSFVAAYFDHGGLYAFGRQPEALSWNVARLAECFMEHASRDDLAAAVQTYSDQLGVELRAAFFRRFNLAHRDPAEDDAVLKAALAFMTESGIGFEQFLFDWQGGIISQDRARTGAAAALYSGDAFDAFRTLIDPYDPANPTRLDHPYFNKAEPCTLLIDEIESIWDAIADRDDWAPLQAKIQAIAEMRTALQS